MDNKKNSHPNVNLICATEKVLSLVINIAAIEWFHIIMYITTNKITYHSIF